MLRKVFVRVMCAEEWWRFGRSSHIHAWDGSDDPEDLPWKEGYASPLRIIPGADCGFRARIDPAHTWSIGVGKDFIGSSLVLLAKLGIFGQGALDTKLACAFDAFRLWQAGAGQTSKLADFSKRSLKMSTRLACVPVLSHIG